MACSEFHSLIVVQSGSLWVCGHLISTCLGHDTLGNSFPNPVRIKPFSFIEEAIVAVSAYSTRSVAVTASGGLYTWGSEPESIYKGLCFPLLTAHHGHESTLQYLPQRVVHTGIPFQHIDSFGPWNYPLTAQELLAFVMGTHLRLGANSPYTAAPSEILECIRTSLSVLAATQMGRGLRNLLGI